MTFTRMPPTTGQFVPRDPEPLAAAAMPSAASQGRRYPEPEHPYRTAYQRDRDRVLGCAGFRRLLFKTQVFVGQPEDHQRNRLTHTLEVSQVARTMARVLRLNEDLVEAIALAHDLGHPPFGHAGERVLDHLLAEHGGFEHNRQSLRVVEVLEHPYTAWPGLNLCYEVLESLAFRCRRPPRPAEFANRHQPLAEAQVVDQADSIAYYAHDVDDALRAGLLTLEALQEVPLWRDLEREARQAHEGELSAKEAARATLRRLVNSQVADVLTESEPRLAGFESPAAVQAAAEPVITPSPALKPRLRELGQFMFDRVYRHPQVLAATAEANECLGELFRRLCELPEQMPESYRRRLDQDLLPRVVGDYLAGMTDRFLLRLHRQLRGG